MKEMRDMTVTLFRMVFVSVLFVCFVLPGHAGDQPSVPFTTA